MRQEVNVPTTARAAWLIPAAVAAVTLIVCIVLYAYAVVPAGPFGWDESSHAVYGLRQVQHLTRADWAAFLRENTAMSVWAFLHAWMLAAVYLIAGVGVLQARAFSLLCLFVFVQVLYRLTADMAPRAGWLAGTLACAFALTSPELLLYAGRAMLELPGLCVGWLAMCFYLRALRDQRWRAYGAAGLLAVATFFTRYEYGLYVMATIIAVEGGRLLLALIASASAARRRQWPMRLATTALFLLLFELAVGFWWLYDNPFRRYSIVLWEEMTHGYAPFTSARVGMNRAWLLLHPTSMARDYTATLAGFALIAIGSAVALTRLSDPRRVALVALFAIGYPIVLLKYPYHPDSQWSPFLEHARYLMMLMPVLWVLAALGLVELGSGLVPRRLRALGVAVGALVVIVFTVGAARVFGDILRGRYTAYVTVEPTSAPYLHALRSAFDGATTPISAYLITGVSDIPPGEAEWQIRRAAPSADVIVWWPPWPEVPAEGYGERLRKLVRQVRTNWIIVTEPADGAVGYAAAAADLPGVQLVTEYAVDGRFVLKVYRRDPKVGENL